MQDKKYKDDIINASPKIVIEAGVRQSWDYILDKNDIFIGMSSFGASAPAKDLYKHFSITEENIVVDQIKLILKQELNIRGKMDVRRIEYFVVYQMDEVTHEKQLSSIYLQHKITKMKSIMSAAEIEATGIMLLEFFDYINTYGAIEIQDKSKILELA